MTPILKWAGGKVWLVPKLHAWMPCLVRDYYEPFAGGAALFFDLAGRELSLEADVERINALRREEKEDEIASYRSAKAFFLSDANPSLIDTYTAIAARPETVHHHLMLHARAHGKHQARRYE